MKKYAVIVAGGKGLRMGSDLPKQFIPVKGLPVLMHTLNVFHACDAGMELILVLPQSQQEYWRRLCQTYRFRVAHRLATGGETRFHSVANGLALVPATDADALVAVHDGVRPFVAASVVAACFDEAVRSGAAVPVVPVVESLRRLDKDAAGGSQTVERDAYRLVQTPQVFKAALLKAAYRQPYTPAFTDDASVVEAMGRAVALVEGNRENIKITTPFDLKVAEAILSD